MRKLLVIGCLGGLAAGVMLAAFLGTVGRGPVRDALALEESLETGSAGAAHEDLFSRGVQEIGGAVGLLVFGLAMGLIFVIVFASVRARLSARTTLGASLQFGAIGFVTVALVPFLRYPSNPPAVGDPDTINERTLLYFAALALSIVLTIVVWQLLQRTSFSPVVRAWLVAAAYAAGLVVIFLGLPANPDSIEVPADLIWRFRLATIAGSCAAWTVLALSVGTLLTRAEHRAGQPDMARKTSSLHSDARA